MTQSSYVKASFHVGLNYTQGRPQLCSSEAYIYSFRSKAGEGEVAKNRKFFGTPCISQDTDPYLAIGAH